MKAIKIGLLGLFFICFSTSLFAQSKNGVKETYKSDTNKTVRIITEIKASSSKQAKAAFFSAFYGFDGRIPKEVVDPHLLIAILGSEDLGDQPSIVFTIDGENEGPYFLERTENGQEDGDKYQQFDLPWSTYRIIRRISTAKIVSGRIGPVEFTLSPTTIRQTAALYSDMPKRKSTPNVLYDKEDNISLIETVETDTTDLKNLKYLDFCADYKYPGRVQGKSITLRISLTFVTNPPIKDHRPLELKLWIDGKLADTFTATYKNEDSSEHGTFQLYSVSEKAMRVIELIAAADTAKCSLGDMEFSLPSETIAQIKMLWLKMQKK